MPWYFEVLTLIIGIGTWELLKFLFRKDPARPYVAECNVEGCGFEVSANEMQYEVLHDAMLKHYLIEHPTSEHLEKFFGVSGDHDS